MTTITPDRLRAYRADPVQLILEQLVLPTGQPYGEVIADFQRDFFTAIFGRNQDGTPRFRLAYEERRRGESKTEDVAAAALADLLTGPQRHRSYVFAVDEDQAGLVLDSIAGFLTRSPLLSTLKPARSTVRNPQTDSELRVMSSDVSSAYGLRPRKVYFDELSLQDHERLWTALWTAIGKSPLSQMVAVSMAGWDFTSLGWRIRELAASNERYYFASREGTTLAPWLSQADVDEQRETLHPADFARLWECRWTEPLGAWITREMYEAAETGQQAHAGRPELRYAGFVDVGLVHDATAVAVCHLERLEPGVDLVVLDSLHTLRGTRTAPVQLEVLEDLVAELAQRYGCRQWIFEAPQAVASVQRLQRRLPLIRVEARYPTADTQARLFGNLYHLFASRRLRLYPHAELKRETLNLVTKTVGGRLKVVDSSSIHQDHVIALGGAAEQLTAVDAAETAIAYMDQTLDEQQQEVAEDYYRRLQAAQAVDLPEGNAGRLAGTVRGF